MSTPQQTNKASAAKKPYEAPELREYGTLQQLTGSAGNTSMARSDGGPPSMDKTH